MTSVYGKAKEVCAQLGGDNDAANSFAQIITFLVNNPSSSSYLKAGETPKSDSYIHRMATRFLKSRSPQIPSTPTTISDSMVGEVLSIYYDVHEKDIEKAMSFHMQAMGAENIIGPFLEAYIASVLEPLGWVWCSGSFVKAVDFIKPNKEMTAWDCLQIKNRDNSENSSSAAIRSGTTIKKWFRSFSKTGNTNWDNFPDPKLRSKLSEADFQTYVKDHLKTVKKISK